MYYKLIFYKFLIFLHCSFALQAIDGDLSSTSSQLRNIQPNKRSSLDGPLPNQKFFYLQPINTPLSTSPSGRTSPKYKYIQTESASSDDVIMIKKLNHLQESEIIGQLKTHFIQTFSESEPYQKADNVQLTPEGKKNLEQFLKWRWASEKAAMDKKHFYKGFVFLAKDETQQFSNILGFTSLFLWNTPGSCFALSQELGKQQVEIPSVYINLAFTTPAARGKGVFGSALEPILKTFFRKVKVAYIAAHRFNYPVIEAYKKMGFVDTDHSDDFNGVNLHPEDSKKELYVSMGMRVPSQENNNGIHPEVLKTKLMEKLNWNLAEANDFVRLFDPSDSPTTSSYNSSTDISDSSGSTSLSSSPKSGGKVESPLLKAMGGSGMGEKSPETDNWRSKSTNDLSALGGTGAY